MMMMGAIKWIEIMKADIVAVDFPVYMLEMVYFRAVSRVDRFVDISYSGSRNKIY